MYQFRAGNQLYCILTILSVAGEVPYRSVKLLGNERVHKKLIMNLTETQVIKNMHTGDTMTCRVFTVSGKGKAKTLRIYKGALPILRWLHPNALETYLDLFWNHKFPGDGAHRERNHRVAESVIMCMRAGIEMRSFYLPDLQIQKRTNQIPCEANLYVAKQLKKVGEMELNKTMFTRMVGAVFSHGTGYAVYNTRNAIMKWSGMGEFKTLHSLQEIARMNSDIRTIHAAILFGQSEEIALATLIKSDKTQRMEFRFDSIYQHIYFIPMNEMGIRQLRFFTVPDWNEKVLELLFDPEDRSYNQGMFEYDALVQGIYVFSFLDFDIARLVRFREAILNKDMKCEVLCFAYQLLFLQTYLGKKVTYKTLDMNLIETELCVERRNLFER